uniref:NR LBD domain-containing protein n=1 Tax=Angiostrongylus cantonensis TaxID=6313 RepID=A0A0K0DQV3_ANGCA
MASIRARGSRLRFQNLDDDGKNRIILRMFPVQNERQPRNTATIRPSVDMDPQNFLREYAGAVSAVLSQPELPPREESPMSAISDKETFPDTPGKILELSLLWTQAVPSFRSLSESEKSHLLNANWRLLFLLSLAEWSHSLLIGVTDYEPAVKTALTSVRSLELDRTEFSCLKAIALFLNESSSNGLFEDHLEQSLTLLNQHTIRNHPTSSRCGRLLLALGHLRSVPPAQVDQILSPEGGHFKILSRYLS